MRIESVQLGGPRTLGTRGAADPLDRRWTSAIWKSPVQGRIWVATDGLVGDHQVYRKGHGGRERAVLLYAAAHYDAWRSEWGTEDLGPGGFGENLTVSGVDELSVCVGDIWDAGQVRLEVSGPREPCMNLVRRHRRPDLIDRVVATGRSGWYARVQREGWIEAGLGLELVERPHPDWPIARVVSVKRHRVARPFEARILADCPALLADWRTRLS